jgi:hypothetical protein
MDYDYSVPMPHMFATCPSNEGFGYGEREDLEGDTPAEARQRLTCPTEIPRAATQQGPARDDLSLSLTPPANFQ